MKHILTRLGVAASVLAVVAMMLLGSPGTTRKAQANPLQIEAFNPSICVALTVATPAGGCVLAYGLDYNSSGHQNLAAAATLLGARIPDGTVLPTDFAGVANFTNLQIHQQDEDPALVPGNLQNGGLAIVAFVDNDAPVTFHTTAGIFHESGTATWVCDDSNNPTPITTPIDTDCGGGPTLTPPAGAPAGTLQQYKEDHAVVAYLQCSAATCPLGPATVTVLQDGIIEPITVTVVGEPRSVQFFTLEKAIQAGNPVTGVLSNSCPVTLGQCTKVSTACPFSASLPFITHALGLAEETVVVARALDINGTPITGAWFNWTVDNNGVATAATFNSDHVTPTNFDSEGILSQATTPTLNLGAFGFGAPNILCAPAGAAAGTVTVRATLTRIAAGALNADPVADPLGKSCPTGVNVCPPGFGLAFGETTFTVSAAPAKMTLAADPPSIPCDGTATSTVSATITDAAGHPAISGTAVNFGSVINATANPINGTTNDKGVATSVISPLAGTKTGVPVKVSVSVGGVVQPDLVQQILVQCTGAAAAAPTPPAGTAPGGAPGGTGRTPTGITGPNTGSGAFGSAGVGSLSWWPMLALVVAAAGLGGLRFAVKRIR